MDEQAVGKLKQIVGESTRAVFFGGAGVSTESGIPDFRSPDGLYYMKYDYPPEQILSHDFFEEKTAEFYRFYREKILLPGKNAKPNAAHRALARLEREGRLAAVVTQNIDGLHDDAGSRAVFELHGSVRRNRCVRCGKSFPLEQILACEGVPRCSCGGVIKPDVVLYGESLDPDVLEGAIDAISRADLLLVAGTSLAVYPAAGLVQYFRGKHLVLINKTPTPMDDEADLVFHEKVGEVLSRVCGDDSA